jgi:hypothetical protein
MHSWQITKGYLCKADCTLIFDPLQQLYEDAVQTTTHTRKCHHAAKRETERVHLSSCIAHHPSRTLIMHADFAACFGLGKVGTAANVSSSLLLLETSSCTVHQPSRSLILQHAV